MSAVTSACLLICWHPLTLHFYTTVCLQVTIWTKPYSLRQCPTQVSALQPSKTEEHRRSLDTEPTGATAWWRESASVKTPTAQGRAFSKKAMAQSSSSGRSANSTLMVGGFCHGITLTVHLLCTSSTDVIYKLLSRQGIHKQVWSGAVELVERVCYRTDSKQEILSQVSCCSLTNNMSLHLI